MTARAAAAILSFAFLCLAIAAAAVGAAHAADTGPALRIVRIGHGNVPAMKAGIVRSVDACQIAKHLPHAAAALPSDAQLTELAVVEQEELFDGQKWAQYDTQRQIGADPANGCRIALFAMRHAVAETTCVSRVTGSTALLGAMMDVNAPSTDAPAIDDAALSPRPCAEKPRVVDVQGLPRDDAGGAACVWNSAVIARAVAKITALAGQQARPPAADIGGHDICLYADRPIVYYQGYGRRVVLMSRTPRVAGHDIADDVGEAAAPGNLRLTSFTSSASIAEARFGRAAIEQFVHLPTKSALGVAP